MTFCIDVDAELTVCVDDDGRATYSSPWGIDAQQALGRIHHQERKLRSRLEMLRKASDAIGLESKALAAVFYGGEIRSERMLPGAREHVCGDGNLCPKCSPASEVKP